ncbi:hypothetical protein HYH03_007717 [Edaphochlamys debaryana]|uniref:Uncharacterized protein n=1 Tax=Edaphochlamys debaryana TaxID=47281 RepID=A0A835Y7Z1_9CHLO|nr:hypothetical protein HYH03_007717 [Edaphochlamys debaryana]|eukprot:KAG2494075.1 hypothetical protein HYH03_007717 [Edaphochlamys debaryana]
MARPHELARNLQAACAVARSFLGPQETYKCVIDPESESRSGLVGSVQAFLLAAQGDPTATTLLLETLDCQASGSSGTPQPRNGPGSGATWLAAFCGLLLGRILDLMQPYGEAPAMSYESEMPYGGGVPYECVREGVLRAVGECCQALRDCTLDLSVVADSWDEQQLRQYCSAVSSLTGDACHATAAAAAAAGGPAEPSGSTPFMKPVGSPHGQPSSRPSKAPVTSQVSDPLGPDVGTWPSAATPLQVAAEGAVGPSADWPIADGGGSDGGPNRAMPDTAVAASAQAWSQHGPHAQQQPRATLRAPAGGHRGAPSAANGKAAGAGAGRDDEEEDDEFGWFDTFDASGGGGARGDVSPSTAASAAAAAPQSDAVVPGGLVEGSLLDDGSGSEASSDQDSSDGGGSNGNRDGGGGGSNSGAGSLSRRRNGTAASGGIGGSGGEAEGSTAIGRGAGAGHHGAGGGGVNGGSETGGRAEYGDGAEQDDEDGDEDEDEAVLRALEDEAAWFFEEGAVARERQAREERRALARLGQGIAAALAAADRAAAAAAVAGGGRRGPGLANGGERAGRGDAGDRGGRAAVAGPGASHRLRPDAGAPAAALAAADAVASAASGCGSSPSSTTPPPPPPPPPPLSGPDALSRLVCSAAAGLAHGRHREMQLAAAAALLLLRPLVSEPAAAAATGAPAAAEPRGSLAEVAARVATAAAALQFDRCVLTVELSGLAAAAAADAASPSAPALAAAAAAGPAVLRGVCVPLAALSAQQSALAASFLAAPSAPPATGPPAQADVSNDGSGGGGDQSHVVNAVFLNGTLQPSHASYGPAVIHVGGAADVTATAGGGAATDVAADVAAALTAASAAGREEALARRILAALDPYRTAPYGSSRCILMASGHVPDGVAALVAELSGGAVLAVGGAGLRVVRAAAAACGVMPAAGLSHLRAASSAVGGGGGSTVANVALDVTATIVSGGLGLDAYRAAAAAGAARPGSMIRLTAPPAPSPTLLPGAAATAAGPRARAGPGWVTLVLAHRLRWELERQAVAVQVCFCRLVAALRCGRVLPGGGAWEVAAAEQLCARALQMERASAAAAHAASASAGKAPWAAAGAGAAAETGDEGGGRAENKEGEGEGEGEEEEALYAPAAYRAVAGALRELVVCVLQNGGAGCGEAAAEVAACGAALRAGDAAALLRRAALARGTEAEEQLASAKVARVGPGSEAEAEAQAGLAAVGGAGGQAGSSCGRPAPGGREGPVAWSELDERRQLAASLHAWLSLRALRPGSGPGLGPDASAGPRAGGAWAGTAREGTPAAVLDEAGAREAGLRGAARLALMACAVDQTIVNSS